METRPDLSLDAYKAARGKFYESADKVFGPGFLSMTEYYYMRKNGTSPFATLFSEPRQVYEEWVRMFKGEEPVRRLLESVAGPAYPDLLDYIRRNDGVSVFDFFRRRSAGPSLAA